MPLSSGRTCLAEWRPGRPGGHLLLWPADSRACRHSIYDQLQGCLKWLTIEKHRFFRPETKMDVDIRIPAYVLIHDYTRLYIKEACSDVYEPYFNDDKLSLALMGVVVVPPHTRCRVCGPRYKRGVKYVKRMSSSTLKSPCRTISSNSILQYVSVRSDFLR